MSSEIETPISVIQDTGNKVNFFILKLINKINFFQVIISICVPGLKKRHGLLHSMIKIFRKKTNPFQLTSNAKFANYKFDSTSLHFIVEVYENSADLKKISSETQKKRYVCKIDKFPTKINAESAEFEV